ncbi:MAG: hypothetical protein ACFFCW_34815, partial [Candidatus Hodarchaeota archaeon]
SMGLVVGLPKFSREPLSTLMEDDFIITGYGNNDFNAAACCLVEGWDVINFNNISYTAQKLYKNDEEAGKRKVDPIASIKPLTTSSRVDLIYLDVWEREVNHDDDEDLIDPQIGVPTCVRRKREWAVRVVEDISGKLSGEIPAEEIKKDDAKRLSKM